METTIYKNKYQHKVNHNIHKQLESKAYDYSNPRHPVFQEIKKNVGDLNFTAEIKQDKRSLDLFKIPGLVSFLCILKQGDKIVGEGRGSSVINKANRYIENAVKYASNSAVIDAVVKSVKTLGTLQIEKENLKDTPISIEELYNEPTNAEKITDKQKKFLRELINTNIINEDQKRNRINCLNDLSRKEASNAIQSFQD